MDIENLKEALRYLREYYMTSRLYNIPVIHGSDALNGVIVKFQEDLSMFEKKGDTDEDKK